MKLTLFVISTIGIYFAYICWQYLPILSVVVLLMLQNILLIYKFEKMKTIKITDKMYSSLMELSKEINSQDHRSMSMPYFFQVQTEKGVVALEGCGDTVYWVDSDGLELRTKEDIEEYIKDYISDEFGDKTAEEISLYFIDKIKGKEADWLLNKDFRRVDIVFEKRYENSFFTAKACQENINANKHHYNKPVTYLNGAFRNPEMELVMKFLCELNGGTLHK